MLSLQKRIISAGGMILPKRTNMTDQIYEYLRKVIPEQGYAPSVREICEAVGLNSPSTVHFHLKRLQERGLIEKGDFKGRAIVLTQENDQNRIPVVGDVAAGVQDGHDCSGSRDVVLVGVFPLDLVEGFFLEA